MTNRGQRCQEMTFIVGAGVSVAPPANLPLFAELRAALIRTLKLSEAATVPNAVEIAETLAPETFMQCIFDGELPIEEWLTTTLGRGAPNPVHAVLAQAIREGARIWTVNVDELIEAAAGAAARVAVLGAERPPDDANLLKPHGTVSGGQYVFRSDQVIKPLPHQWAQRLLADCYGRHVVIVGYAGQDVDLRLVLNEALERASGVTWFEVEQNRPGLLERIPNLKNFTEPFVGNTEARQLSADFLKWAADRSLPAPILVRTRTSLLATPPDTPPLDGAIPPLDGDTRLARGFLLERIGDRKAAKRNYRRAALSRHRRQKALHKYQTIAFYGGAWWTRPIIWWSAGPLASFMPSKLRKRADRVHVTRLSSHQGNHRAALRRAQRVGDPDDPAILLAQAKGARYTGDLQDALEKAGRCEILAREHDSVDELAHALFETAFASIWAGDFVEAQSILRELFSGVDALAGVRWVAWALWQHACLAIYDNRATDALKDLAESYSLFGSDNLPAGQVAALTVQLTAARLVGNDALFKQTERQIDQLRGTPGWTPFTDASIDHERAEWLRIRGELDVCSRLNDRVISTSQGYPVHLGLALLRRAEIERAMGQDNRSTTGELQALLDQHPMAYLAAHLGITEFLSGRTSEAAALQRVLATCPLLTTRDATPATSPLDYCLGTPSERHELFLP
jgi:tetratricopeptide (TPR) repeat protein